MFIVENILCDVLCEVEMWLMLYSGVKFRQNTRICRKSICKAKFHMVIPIKIRNLQDLLADLLMMINTFDIPDSNVTFAILLKCFVTCSCYALGLAHTKIIFIFKKSFPFSKDCEMQATGK